MRNHVDLDDSTADAVLRGVVPADRPDLDALVALTSELRALRTGTAPTPTGQLARLLAGGLAPIDDKGDRLVTAGSTARPAPQGSGLPKRRKTVLAELLTTATTKLGAASLLAKGAVGVSIALAGVTGTASADVLPQPVQDRVATAVEWVAPFDLPDSADQRPEPAPTGREVASDAKNGGVDGRELGEAARKEAKPDQLPRQAGRPQTAPSGRPEAPGAPGLSTANDGPAAEHAPDAVPTPARPVEAPAQRPAQAPGQQSADSPAHRPAEVPAQQPAEAEQSGARASRGAEEATDASGTGTGRAPVRG